MVEHPASTAQRTGAICLMNLSLAGSVKEMTCRVRAIGGGDAVDATEAVFMGERTDAHCPIRNETSVGLQCLVARVSSRFLIAPEPFVEGDE